MMKEKGIIYMAKQDDKTPLDDVQNSIIVRKLSIYERFKLLREARTACRSAKFGEMPKYKAVDAPFIGYGMTEEKAIKDAEIPW